MLGSQERVRIAETLPQTDTLDACKVVNEHFEHLYPRIRAGYEPTTTWKQSLDHDGACTGGTRRRVLDWAQLVGGWRQKKGAAQRQPSRARSICRSGSVQRSLAAQQWLQQARSPAAEAHCCAAYKDPQPSNQSQTPRVRPAGRQPQNNRGGSAPRWRRWHSVGS